MAWSPDELNQVTAEVIKRKTYHPLPWAYPEDILNTAWERIIARRAPINPPNLSPVGLSFRALLRPTRNLTGASAQASNAGPATDGAHIALTVCAVKYGMRR